MSTVTSRPAEYRTVSKLSYTKILAAIAVSLFSQVAGAVATVSWSTWTAPAAYPYKATVWVQPAIGPGKDVNYFYTDAVNGTLVLPGPTPTTVSISVTGEVMSSSCWQADWQNCDPKEWWYKWGGWGAVNSPTTFPQGGPQGTPPGTFTSPLVPDLPSNSYEIATVGGKAAAGGTANQIQTITFSQPLNNVVLNIFSLGRQSQISTFVFDQPFTVLSQNPDCVTKNVKCFVVSGNTISGLEGSGTLFFAGPVNAISWTITVPENYTGYNLGVSYSLVTVTAANANGTFGGGVPPISYTATGFNGTDNFTTAPTCQAYTDATYATLVTPASPPGTYVTHCSGGVAPTGYDLSYVDGTYTVAPAPVTVAAQNVSSVFGAPIPVIPYTATGFIGSDNFTTPPVCKPYTDGSYTTEVTSSTPPGNYVTHCTGGVAAPGYSFTYVDGVYSVQAATVTVTANSGSSIFGAAIGATGYTTDVSVTFTTPPSCGVYTDKTYATAVTSSTLPGTYVTHCKDAIATGYAVSYVDGTYTITPGALTVTANDASSTYGSAIPPIGFTESSSVPFKTPPVCGVYTDATYSTPVTANTLPGKYVTHCKDGVADGYTVSYTDGVFILSAAPAFVEAQDAGSAFGTPPSLVGYDSVPSNIPFTTPPTCAAYLDASYTALVTATTPAGTYVTHCSGGVAPGYQFQYVDGIYTVSNQAMKGTCGTANGVFTQTPPATTDLCSTGTPSMVAQLPDGSFSWSCAGKGGGTSSSCSSSNGKPNQALQLGPVYSTVRSGRGATLRVKGAKGTGKVTYSVVATSGLSCSLRFTSNAQVFVKTRGRANGSCKVVAKKAGDARYNPATSNVATVNVNCANP